MKFELSEKELENYYKWLQCHLKEKHDGKWPYAGAAGGSISFIFTPTGLGDCISVQCNHCNEIKSITDFEAW